MTGFFVVTVCCGVLGCATASSTGSSVSAAAAAVSENRNEFVGVVDGVDFGDETCIVTLRMDRGVASVQSDFGVCESAQELHGKEAHIST